MSVYRKSSPPPVVEIPKGPWRARLRVWWDSNGGDAMGAALLFSLLAFIGWTLYGLCVDEMNDPCDRYVRGTVTVQDDQGRPAQVDHRWCVKWKPGREPKK